MEKQPGDSETDYTEIIRTETSSLQKITKGVLVPNSSVHVTLLGNFNYFFEGGKDVSP